MKIVEIKINMSYMLQIKRKKKDQSEIVFLILLKQNCRKKNKHNFTWPIKRRMFEFSEARRTVQTTMRAVPTARRSVRQLSGQA